MKKNGKKIFLLLLILTLVGVVGYGVYSYYYASGSVTHTGTIEIDGFNVTLYDTYGLVNENVEPIFISGNHESILNCEYIGGESFNCSVSVQINNFGSKDIEAVVSNFNVSLSGYDNSFMNNQNITFYAPDWVYNSSDHTYTSIIHPEDYNNFDISVIVEIPNYIPDDGNPVELTSPIEGGELEVIVSYDVLATEVHD